MRTVEREISGEKVDPMKSANSEKGISGKGKVGDVVVVIVEKVQFQLHFPHRRAAVARCLRLSDDAKRVGRMSVHKSAHSPLQDRRDRRDGAGSIMVGTDWR